MMFDVNLTVLAVDIIAPEMDEEGHLLEEDSPVNVKLTIGIVTPGPQGVMALPLGRVGFSMGKDMTIDKANAMLAAAALIPDKHELPSDFVVATGGQEQVRAVAKQVETVEKMKRGKR